MDIREIERQATAVAAVIPTLQLVLDNWYQSLKEAMNATQAFALAIERINFEETRALSVWESEGGACEQ